MSEFTEWELTLHILKVLGIVGIIIVLLFVVLYFILKSFIISYVTEKGKNLATKEDIAEITKKTEEIKTLYAKQLEETLQQNRVILEQYKTENQLRMAALESRLKVHQNAYLLWNKVVTNVHNQETITKVIIECQEWWKSNCLYLTANSREAFWDCIHSADLHRNFLVINKTSPSEKAKNDVLENWHKIMNAGKVIVESVSLPAINAELEIKESPTLDADPNAKNN